MRFEKHHSPEGGWDDDAMRRFVRDNSLSIVTVGAFLVIWLGGQAWRLCAAHRLARAEGIGRVQPHRGDPTLDEDPRGHRADPNAPWPVRRGGLVLRIYQHSLSIALLGLFLLAFLGHLVTGARAFNAEQVEHGGATVSTVGYFQTGSQ